MTTNLKHLRVHKTSQFPRPTCYWKWVGGTKPLRAPNWTLKPIFSPKIDCDHWVGHIFRIWHTKINNFNWKNKSLFFIEDAIVKFLSSPFLGHSLHPIWDSFYKVYFSGSPLSYLLRTTGQDSVQGVSLWSISAYCDCVLGINNQSMKTKLILHVAHYAVHGPSA